MVKQIVAGCLLSSLFMLNASSAISSEINLPRTGQTLCYDTAGTVIGCAGTGQDGAILAGQPSPSPRFTAVNGAVTDNLTGLIWLQDANCSATLGGVAKTTTLTWSNAVTWSNNLASGHCGLSDGSIAGDWRLPSVLELGTLADLSTSYPALPVGHPFSNSQNESAYWSDTNFGAIDHMAYMFDVQTGATFIDYKPNSQNVWPVRGGE